MLRDKAIVEQKSLLAYPCMIMQICLDVGVLEISKIDDIREDFLTFDI